MEGFALDRRHVGRPEAADGVASGAIACAPALSVDVQTLDRFDQQENCFSGRAKLLIADVNKTRAPGAELFDLALVQTIAQRSVHQGLGRSTTA
jgi:hypothetical protein